MNPEVAAYNAKQSAPEDIICNVLSEQINLNLPEAENKLWHGHPVWFLDGNPIVGYGKLKSCIRLLFWSGQSFEEVGLNPEGKFKAAEVRYTSPDEINTEDLARWIRKGKFIQWDYKNIVKRKGELIRLM